VIQLPGYYDHLHLPCGRSPQHDGVMRARHLLAVLAAPVLALSAVAAPAAAAPRAETTTVYTLDPSTHGNPEGVAWDPATRAFFVSSVGDGTIYRGTLPDPTVRPAIPGPGAPAVGMKVAGGKLFVAGGPAGDVRVYDTRSGAQVGEFTTPGTGGFLNDLVVTEAGDVWITDSFRPVLWHLTPALVKAGSGQALGVPVGPEITYQPGFNLNGIVALEDGKRLVVVQANIGTLFRIDLAGAGRRITPVAGVSVPGGDGLLVDRGRLLVVQGNPAQISVLKLREATATLDGVITDPTLRGPSTVARAQDRYLVVNADFALSRTPFTVSGLPR
jgi:sugar lactone lactonase YvrE